MKTSEQEKSGQLEESSPIKLEGWKLVGFAAIWLGLLLSIKVFFVPMVKQNFGNWICVFEAIHCTALANFVGIDAVRQGNQITTPNFSILIWFACTGTDYMLYLAGLVALFPGKIRYRWLWMLGLPLAFYLVIQIRLLLFLIIGGRWPDWVPFLHDTWNGGLVVMFVLFWLIFLGVQMRSGVSERKTVAEPETAL